MCDLGLATTYAAGRIGRWTPNTRYKSRQRSGSSSADSTTGIFSNNPRAHLSFHPTLHTSPSTLHPHRQPCPAFSSPPCPLPALLSSSVRALCRDHCAIRLTNAFPSLVACPTMISELLYCASSGYRANFTECRRSRVAHDPPHDRKQQRLRRAQVPCLRHRRVPHLWEQERVHQCQHRHPPRPPLRRGRLTKQRSRSSFVSDHLHSSPARLISASAPRASRSSP